MIILRFPQWCLFLKSLVYSIKCYTDRRLVNSIDEVHHRGLSTNNDVRQDEN